MEVSNTSFFERLGLAFKVLFNATLADQVKRQLATSAPAPKPVEKPVPPERLHASGLALLGALQREGRIVDFLQQDVAGFSDEEVGAAARVVHAGCRKVLSQYFTVEPASREAEGSNLTLPAGFDAQRIRLTGNVSGPAPYKGTLKHHGWVVSEVRLPTPSEAMDPRVIAPAEVELP